MVSGSCTRRTSRPRQRAPERFVMLRELRRIPAGFATFLVVGAAVVTMIILAAFESAVGREDQQSLRTAALRATPPVVELGRSYAKGKRQPAQTPAQAP